MKSAPEFIELKKFLPHYDKELYIVTPWGIRTATLNKGTFGFILTDCIHPMENPFLPDYFVCDWTYKNEIDRANILDLISPNHYQRQREGEEILSTVRYTKWDEFRTAILSMLKRLRP